MQVADKGVLRLLQSKIVTKPEFNYDMLRTVPLTDLFTSYDNDQLYNIATSARYSGNPKKKHDKILEILHKRGFVKISGGTNRIAFRHLEIPNICVKIASDETGIHDNPREFMNQWLLKPFCTKVFESTPDGVIGLFERVIPIKSREQFASVADQIFELIDVITTKYILADFGTHYFMNYGFREGFGPVILDFPYVYETDPSRLICKKPTMYPDGTMNICGGLIDYDAGYNELVCKKCGARYRAIELASYINSGIIMDKGEKSKMLKLSVIKNGEKIPMYDTTMQDAAENIGEKPKKIPTSSDGCILSGHWIKSANAKVDDKKPEVKEEPKHEVKEEQPKNKTPERTYGTTKVSFGTKKVDPDKAETVHSSLSLSGKSVPKNNNKKNKKNNNQQKFAPKSEPVDVNLSIVKSRTNQNNIDKKAEEQHESNDVAIVTGYDAENNIMFVKANNTTFRINTNEVEDHMAAVVESLTHRSTEYNAMSEELEKAKADLVSLEDRNLELVQENDELKAMNSEDNNKNTEKMLEMEKRLKFLESAIDDLEKQKQYLKESNESISNKAIDLSEKYRELEANFAKVVEERDDLAAKNAELESLEGVSDDSAADQADNEESDYAEVAEESEYRSAVDDNGFTRFSELEGKYTTYGVVAGHLGGQVDENIDPDGKIIVFEDGDGGYFTDQFGGVIAMSSINGKLLSDHELRFKKIKENEEQQ